MRWPNNCLILYCLKFELRVATIVDVKNAQESFANAGLSFSEYELRSKSG
jgi:hypothetical protein